MEDIDGNRLCGCPQLQVDGCPKPELVTLYTISKMPQSIKRAVIQRINLTRQGPEQSRWKASSTAVICNVHYEDFMGPSKTNKFCIPVYFKKPSTTPASKKARIEEEDMQDTTSGYQDEDLDDLSLQDTQPETIRVSLDICTASSTSQLDLDAELYLESTEFTDRTEDTQSDTVPIQSHLHGLDAEDPGTASSSTQLVNAELCCEPAMIVSGTPVSQPHDLSSPDVASIVSRCAQVEQENSELRAENLALKQKLETFNSTVQRLSLSLLTESKLQMYTGLPRKVFECLLAWIIPAVRKRGARDELDPSQKLLLVMMRVRYNFPQSDLAFRFNIDQSTVSRILNQWIPMLKVQLKQLIRWPQTTIGPIDPPYNLLPNAVAIIDGTEIFIERPSNLATQKSSYSDYKSHTTVKYLVATDTFTGVFVYVSPGFSGNSSDRFTIEHSGILDQLKPGQRILADKGYNARDLFAQKRCFLTIPSFLSEGRLTAQEGLNSRTIASARIRVENAIKRLKEYKALSETLSNRVNKKIVDDMVLVAGALCNLKQKLIK